MVAQYSPIFNPNPKPQAWRPNPWKYIPWLGLSAWFGAILATAGAVAVLSSSNMKPTDEWPSKTIQFQPTVLLAILTAITNTFLRFAFSEGTTITWRKEAFRGGTIENLHRNWAHGLSLWAAVTSGRHLNMLAVGCILTSVVVIDGPLLQRAPTVEAYQDSEVTDLPIHLFSKDLPQFFSAYGSFSADGNVAANTDDPSSYYTQPFIKVVQAFNSRSNMTLPRSSTCIGTCSATVVAPAFDIDCQEHSQEYNVLAQTAQLTGTAITLGYVGFSTPYDAPDTLKISTFHKQSEGCIGSAKGAVCTLRNSLARYSMVFDNTRVIQWNKTETLSITNYNASSEHLSLASTNGGFIMAANALYSGNVSLQWFGLDQGMANAPPIPALYASFTGPFAHNYINTPDQGTNVQFTEQSNCTTTWSDPLPDILDGLEEMMLRSAISLSNSTTTQVVSGTAARTRTRYVSNFRYLGGALVLMLVSTFIVLPLFMGWRHFSRSMSLSPIETAKAFGAPVLEEGSSMDEISGLLTSLGGKKVQYGAVIALEMDKALVTQDGGKFGSDRDIVMQRLMIVGAERATKPQIGQLFI
jgi:hypothetical protein